MVAPEVFCAHSRRMSADDADRLGPKGHVFVELVREQWRAPLERPGARRAIMLASVGLGVILLAGLMSIRATLSPGVALGFIALGGLAVLSAMPELRQVIPEFAESRRIGWVEPTLDDHSVTVGEPATFRAVLHARRSLSLRNLTLVAEARRWKGALPADRAISLPLPVSVRGGDIASGEDWRQTVTFRIPDTAPPSYYTPTESLRWTLKLEMTFAGERQWSRTWPMLVFPADAP